MKEILHNQIYRLARIYISRPVCSENLLWHLKVGRLQANCIREYKSLKKGTKKVWEPALPL